MSANAICPGSHAETRRRGSAEAWHAGIFVISRGGRREHEFQSVVIDECIPMRYFLWRTANRRHGLYELWLIGHTVDAGGHDTGTVNHDDDGVRFDSVLLG